MSQPAQSGESSERWISQDYGILARQALEAEKTEVPLVFDVLVIGSGYGGAIAAAELAGNSKAGSPISLCVLERGKEYLPGMFPARMEELPRHVRLSQPGSPEPTGMRQGLFDFRLSTDISALVANGLGGGSLINAGVMEIPNESVFDEHWPQSLQKRTALDPYFALAKKTLGAQSGHQDRTIHQHVLGETPEKHKAFKRLAPEDSSFRPAAITVAMKDGQETCAGVKLDACKLCGDCATGCNYSAKESLDTNMLVRAYTRGAQIYTGATVLYLDRNHDDNSWIIFTTFTDKSQSLRQGPPIKIRARQVILAAGTLGSTEILQRSQAKSIHLSFSEQLGSGFSGNGDMIATGFAQKHEVNAVASEQQPASRRKVGPTITGIIDAKASSGRMVFEELAVPGPLRRAFEEVYTTADMLNWLARSDKSQHKNEHPELDPFAVNSRNIRNSQIYAAMGDDGAQGQLKLEEGKNTQLCDGAIKIHWPSVNKHPLFESQVAKLEQMAEQAGVEGSTIPNPIWKLLPDDMLDLINDQRGPLLTVHPLGGCRMADDASQGVVTDLGLVYKGTNGNHVFENLAVLDGAIIPSALCTNPALTIAATAYRAIEHLRQNWGFTEALADAGFNEAKARPLWRNAEQIQAKETQDSIAKFTERLSGEICLHGQDTAAHFAEITLFYEDQSIAGLVSADENGQLKNAVLNTKHHDDDSASPQSRLRIFKAEDWKRIREENCSTEERESLLEDKALFIAPLKGSLRIFRREPSGGCRRRARSLYAWLFNRGIRDVWQSLFGTAGNASRLKKNKGFGNFLKRTRSLWRMASHAGEVRLFEYDLDILEPLRQSKDFSWPSVSDSSGEQNLRGVKRITYKRPGNPWRQLMEMTVLEMPGVNTARPAILALDNSYMANKGIPLLQIKQQENQVTALSDLISLAGYMMRMLFSIHIWSARLPEPPINEPNRLPGKVPGLPAPKTISLTTDKHGDTDIEIILTHYPAKNKDAIPVAMFHGYSASGTTFAHHAPPTDIARTLHAEGRDVWVVDLRTSCGLPKTATLPWTFERVALMDIPAAIDHIYNATGGKKIDVLAHCMGSVMFSMAVLSAGKDYDEIVTPWDQDFKDNYRAQRDALPQRIRRLVLSQVGPLVVFSPRNVFSAYVTNYLRYFLPVENYQFRPSDNPGLTEQLMDRLLATLPYPDDELLLENPWWPPWRSTAYVGTRHRMDAMYGRDFKLANLDQNTLDYIDDYFGPLNPETVSQVIHFHRLQMISNRFGRNRFIFRKLLRKNWTFPTLSIHGDENGLSDVATLERMRSVMADAGRQYETFRVEKYGHQDCWIGKDAGKDVFPKIIDFLTRQIDPPAESKIDTPVIQMPWAGPVVGLPLDYDSGRFHVPVSLSAPPSIGRPEQILLLPVANYGSASNKQWSAVYKGQTLPPHADIPDEAIHRVIVESPYQDWFRINVPIELFEAPADGVMILTTHDQSAKLIARTFDENF